MILAMFSHLEEYKRDSNPDCYTLTRSEVELLGVPGVGNNLIFILGSPCKRDS
jgi:hypothetical protein